MDYNISNLTDPENNIEVKEIIDKSGISQNRPIDIRYPLWLVQNTNNSEEKINKNAFGLFYTMSDTIISLTLEGPKKNSLTEWGEIKNRP